MEWKYEAEQETKNPTKAEKGSIYRENIKTGSEKNRERKRRELTTQ